jgi:hypothetical protein
MVGNQADPGGTQRHQYDGQRQRRFAAAYVAHPPQHDAAQWPRQKTHAKGGEGSEQGGHLIGAGKELRATTVATKP